MLIFLGYLFRATGGGVRKVAGLGPLTEVPSIENINVSEWVPGHMSYRAAMPRLLREVGWMVESDEFTEIEDPDPDNHDQRQRELIDEIEEARKALEAKPEKKRFGFFSRKKVAEKKAWEMYDEKPKAAIGSKEESTEVKSEGVLFDIDAIRAEVADLAGHGIEVKQLESTLPPMKLNLESSPAPLRTTRSFNDSIGVSSPHTSDGSLTHLSTADQPEFARSVSKSPALGDYGSKDNATGEDDGMTMTFETPPPSRTTLGTPEQFHTPYSSPKHLPADRAPSPLAHATDWETPVSAHRPALKSHATSPTPASLAPINLAPVNLAPISLEHNAWADEDDEFGKETEMKMTFE
jgi:hypothetical protein